MSETHDGITFNGDPQKMKTSANNTAACQGELEVRLSALAGVQDELHAAVVSKGAGDAIYNALGNAHTAGKSLSQTLQEIISTLGDFSVKADAQDTDAGSQIARAGNDGVSGGSTWSGSNAAVSGINTSAGNFKVDTNSWA